MSLVRRKERILGSKDILVLAGVEGGMIESSRVR